MTTSRGARTPKGAEPVRARPQPAGAAGRPRDDECGATGRLLFVSAGLSPRGGGIAAAGRLLLAATREWAASQGVALRLLTLGEPSDLPAGADGEAFQGNRGALARAIWRAQIVEGYRHHVYDFLGVARIQGVLPRRWRARYLLYLYGIECWRPLRGSRRRALDGAAARLACSSFTADRLRRLNPGTPPVTPLHLAVDDLPTTSTGADDALLAALGEGFLLIVGRLAPGERYKGHDELLEALATLAPTHPDLRLVVAGEGEDRRRLEARAAELGVAPRVSFVGFVSAATLVALYRRCALFAMPSDGEGFGLVYLEAMRTGRPCIARAASAAAEIVVDGETGRLVEAGAAPLAAAIAGILADPFATAAMGAAGRERWQQCFRPAQFAAGLRPHLDQLLAPAPLCQRREVVVPSTRSASSTGAR